MIHVTVYQNAAKMNISVFRHEGHAGYAPEGQDIVCAAASVLMINTMNAIEAVYTDDAFCTLMRTDGSDAFPTGIDGILSTEAALLSEVDGSRT